MKKIFCLVLAITALALGVATTARAEDPMGGKRVTVYMYSEYIDPELVKSFEEKFGVELKIDVYENSEDMLAKMLNAGGDSQYDVVVVSDVAVPALINRGAVRPLDPTKIPNKVNVAEDFRKPPFDPGMKFSLPYQWGTVGLMYQKKLITAKEVSWAVVFDPKQQPGMFTLMDSMRDTLGIALLYTGHGMNSINPAELKQAADALLAAKKSRKCIGFEGGVGGKNKVLAGEAGMAIVYNGDAVRGIKEEEKSDTVDFVVPKEGGVIWVDVMLISAKAPNPEGGHAFINFILDAENGARLSNFNRYPTPNKASFPLIQEEDRKDPRLYPPAGEMRNLEYLHDLGTHTRLYDEVWTMVKSK